MISVRDLKRETGLKKNVSLELRFKEIEGYKILSPVFIDIEIENLGIGFKVKGNYRVTVELQCRRCLILFPYKLNSEIDEIYTTQKEKYMIKKLLTMDELSTFNFNGEEINIKESIRQNIIVSIPPYPLCKIDCKGLCPVCGKNWNYDECEHLNEIDQNEFEENPFYKIYLNLMKKNAKPPERNINKKK
ncbi:MAG TPA: DUF177 domain-containing protein [Caldisericia bacterium]|nr:DUF177 domain-containing protein [Caldisericia bacterium]